MNIGFIKKLINVVEESNIEEVEIRRFWTKIRISKDKGQKVSAVKISAADLETRVAEKTEKKSIKGELQKEDTDLHTIKSPMVGTFYRAPAPDAPPYVEKGDMIKKGDIVCIIEAMKIMNEIESDIRGEIVEVLVSNEDPVEYNQPLFTVRKS
jgi:acetyl-CoA carboxylase biotin carboxyl carrier protein